MLSYNQAKHLHSLRLPKFRKAHRQFIAEGVKLADELLASSYSISSVYALAGWLTENEASLRDRNIVYQEINELELSRISQMVTPNEVVLVVNMPDDDGDDIPFDDLVLFLDRIQDPGNMGTIIRSADWFGIKEIVCSPGCADIYNRKVVQSSMGSITRVKVRERDSESFLKEASGHVTIYGAVLEGDNLYQQELRSPALLVIGNESQGIAKDLLPYIQHKTSIPGYSPKVESLNAAIATSIILSEFRRRLA